MGERRINCLRKSSRLHYDDGLVPGEPFYGAHEFLCVPDAFFHVKDDTSRLEITAEEVDQVTVVHIHHRSEGSENAKAGMGDGRPVKDGAPQSPALRNESDVSSFRQDL